MEEFDLDEIAELSGLLKIAELEESSKREKSSVPKPLEDPFKLIKDIKKDTTEENNLDSFIATFPKSESFVKSLSEDQIKRFFEFISYLNLAFNDNWDLHKNTESTLKVIIYFKESKMSNSDNNSHTLRDFFISFIIDKSMSLIGSFSGFKTTLTYLEMNSIKRNRVVSHDSFSGTDNVYLHSHLKGDFNQFKNIIPLTFCLGQSELAVKLRKLQDIERCMDNWLPSLLLLEPLVRWESLEGTPYRYMRNIYRRNSRSSILSNLTIYYRGSRSLIISKGLQDRYIDSVRLFIDKYIKIIGFNKGKLKLQIKEDSIKEYIYWYLETENSNLEDFELFFISKIAYYEVSSNLKYVITSTFKSTYIQALEQKRVKDSNNNSEENFIEEEYVVSSKTLEFRDKVFKPTVIKTKETVDEEDLTSLLGGSICIDKESILYEIAKNKLYNSFLRINYDFNK